MNNTGATLVKLVALAGGALAGALLARWYDHYVTTQAQERSNYDKTRYAQGLTPLAPQPKPADIHNQEEGTDTWQAQ